MAVPVSSNDRGATIVSGATFGIGKAIATLLAERGWPVIAFGLEPSQLESTHLESAQATSSLPTSVTELQADADKHGLPLRYLVADLTDPADISSVAEAAIQHHGHIHAVVNCAAIGPLGTVLDTDPELWDKIHAVNLKGPFLMCRAVIPHMKQSGGGRIVNIGSGAGWGKPNMASYAASKAGLTALSAALALDHFHDHIAVNTVIPGGGGIATGMSLSRVDGDLEKLRASAVGNVAGRYTTGEDVAKAVAFLLSDDAEAISGTVIDVGCFAHQGSSVPLPTIKDKPQ
ncbi:MAG: SDR family NAD(P)-dependent oxidoreductase [Acidimicrobiales bacterium]